MLYSILYTLLNKLGYNTPKATGSPGSIYTKKSHKNIKKQNLIARKKSGAASHRKKDLFQRKKIMWLYNLSHGLSPVLFLNISHTSYQ